MHWCMNVVTGPDGVASAVLLRAGEVVDGLELAAARRPGSSARDLARGPARLTKALGVDSSHGGIDLLDPRSPVTLSLAEPPPADQVRTGPRVGVAGEGAATEWRFWLAGEPTVSVYRPAVPRRPRVKA
jgi:DNA-3-methyladenine glycosylase